MTTKTLYGAIMAVCLSCALTSVAFGQACPASPVGGTITAPNSPAGVAGNTCNHNLTQLNICQNGDTLNGNGVDIYSVTIGAGNNFNVTVTSAAFQPELALTTTTACTSNAPCSIDVTTPPAAVSPYSVTGSATGLVAGTHFIFVGDVGLDSPGCGAYNLNVTAQLPVELKNFSVD